MNNKLRCLHSTLYINTTTCRKRSKHPYSFVPFWAERTSSSCWTSDRDAASQSLRCPNITAKNDKDHLALEKHVVFLFVFPTKRWRNTLWWLKDRLLKKESRVKIYTFEGISCEVKLNETIVTGETCPCCARP